jgi:hypothetical protein
MPAGIARAQGGSSWVTRGFALGVTVALIVVATLAFGDTKPTSVNLQVAPIDVIATPIAAFDRIDAGKSRFGRLTWRGGLVLTSPSKNFGGWSGLALDAGGEHFLAISDAGAWMTGTLSYGGGRLKGMEKVQLGPLRAVSGQTMPRYRDRDAEGLTMLDGDPTKGRVLIGFERHQRLGEYEIDAKGLSAARKFFKPPAAAKHMDPNSGFEAITVLRGGPNKGALVTISERFLDAAGDHTGWLWIGGVAKQFQIKNIGDFDITDAAGLPDGRVLLLERRFRWSEGVKVRLRLLAADELRPGAHARGETLLDATMSQEIDNMEGLAVHTGPGSEIIITMISDDNFNTAIQRTLLLQFAFDGRGLASAAPPRQ